VKENPFQLLFKQITADYLTNLYRSLSPTISNCKQIQPLWYCV